MSAQNYLNLITLSSLIALVFPNVSYAQEISGAQIATNVEVDDSNIKAGDILSITPENKIIKSSVAYDKKIFGVVVEDPAIVLNKETSKTIASLSQGEAQVKVSTKNGNIQVGDFITSSDEAGIGQKATTEGMVIGKALANYTGQGVASLPVYVNIQYQSQISAGDINSLWERVVAFTSEGLRQPENFQLLLRYIFALLVGGLSFIFGFIFAARALRTGLVAVGRNPLARGTIEVNMFLNLGALLFLSIAGVGLSLFIIFYR